MKFVISIFVLVAVLSISARQQTPTKTYSPVYVKKELIVKNVSLLKPSDSLISALNSLDYKSSICSKGVNKILKSKKDSLYLITNRSQ